MGKVKIIGVTGPIGSGKSTVSGILHDEWKAKVIDADQIAREVVRKGEKALSEMVDYFGPEILDEKGELIRSKLAEMVFGNEEKVKVLNAITHKHIMERLLNRLEQAKSEAWPEGVIVVDVPLPVKHGFLDTVDEVWVVYADPETRIGRVMERSGLSRQEVIARMNSQMSDEEYLKLADKVILNNGSKEKLKEQIIRLMRSG